MSEQKVDVLAVLDDIVRFARWDNSWNSMDEADYQQARAAVAELIAVANRMDSRGFFDDVPYSPDADLGAMKAALARVGGAA